MTIAVKALLEPAVQLGPEQRAEFMRIARADLENYRYRVSLGAEFDAAIRP